MKRELALEFARVTEAAALAAYKWVGKGNSFVLLWVEEKKKQLTKLV